MLKLYHIFPDLLNLYGDRANLWALCRHLDGLGYPAEVVPVHPGDNPDFSAAAGIYLGPGTERHILLALGYIRPLADMLRAALDGGLPLLATGSAVELLGRRLVLPDGMELPTLGVFNYSAFRTDYRITGDVIGNSDRLKHKTVGFVNCQSLLASIRDPLFNCELGPATCVTQPGEPDPDPGPGKEYLGQAIGEGVLEGSKLATYLLGPLLIRNPHIRHAAANAVLSFSGYDTAQGGDREWDDYAGLGYKITLEQLQKQIKTQV